MSVQDLFDAPAAEEEIEAFLDRLDKTVGNVSSQEVLASSNTHSHVPQLLSQRGGGHRLGKRSLGMHGSREERADKGEEKAVKWLRRNSRRGLKNEL